MDIMNVIVSTLAIGVVGCVMHFLYGWSHQNKAVAVVAATNESVWEHIKIGLTGFLLFTIYDYLQYGEMHNYWIAKGVALMGFVVIVPSVYYGLKSYISKKNEMVANIISFFVDILLAQMMFFAILEGPKLRDWLFYPAFIMLFLVLGAYVMFTWVQPRLGIFQDPINGKYGVDAYQKSNHAKKHERAKITKAKVKQAKKVVNKRVEAAKKARVVKSIDGMK